VADGVSCLRKHLTYRYFAGLLVGCFQGVSKQQLLSPLFSPVTDYWEKNPLVIVYCN